MEINFRCVPRFEPILPRPTPAVLGLPSWLRSMPTTAFSPHFQKEVQTVKQCAPFIDAVTHGYLIPLAADVLVENGRFTWDRAALHGKPPISFHENVQVSGTPFFDERRSLIKFINFWTIETPPDYSLLVVHPINRHDLPFVTLTGLVDSDRYVDNMINFPARWRDPKFNGVLPKGLPVAQCLPVKREEWTMTCTSMDDEAAARLVEVSKATAEEEGVYRREFRTSKHRR